MIGRCLAGVALFALGVLAGTQSTQPTEIGAAAIPAASSPPPKNNSKPSLREPASLNAAEETFTIQSRFDLADEALAYVPMSMISRYYDLRKRGFELDRREQFGGIKVGVFPPRKELRQHRNYIRELSVKMANEKMAWKMAGTWKSGDHYGPYEILIISSAGLGRSDGCYVISARFINQEGVPEELREDVCDDRIILRDGTYFAVIPTHGDYSLGEYFSMLAISLPFGAENGFEFVPDGENGWVKAAPNLSQRITEIDHWEIKSDWVHFYNDWLDKDSAARGEPPPKRAVLNEDGEFEEPD